MTSTFQDGTLYIPNVFTPNGDGIHDRLILIGDSVRQISSIEIKNKIGAVVFYNRNLPVNDYNTAWDGEFNGRIEKGMYSYRIWAVSIKGYKWEINGNVCNCPCDQESDEDLIPIRNCQFGVCDTILEDCDHNEYLPCFQY